MDLYYFDEDYYTPSLGYFEYTAVAASALNTAATQSVTANRIKTFRTNSESFYVAGLQLVTATSQHAKSPTTSAVGAFVLDPGMVVSAWYQKDTSNQAQGYLLGNNVSAGTPLNGHHLRIIGSTYVELYYNQGPVNGKFIWSSASPADTAWHQYTVLFRDRTYNGQNYTQSAELFTDGVSQGVLTNLYSGGQNSNSGYDMYNGPVLIGRGVNGSGVPSNTGLPNPGANTNEVDTACAAQVGYWPLSVYTDFDITKFYNTTNTGTDPGYLDMGPAGVGTGLPTPKFFASLDQPFGIIVVGVKNGIDYTESDSTWFCAVGLASTGVHGRFFLAAAALKTREFAASLNSAFTQNASARKTSITAVTLSSAATQTANNTTLKESAVLFSALYTELTAASKIAQSPITFTTAFAFTCDALAGKLLEATLNSTATLTVNYIVAKIASAALTSAFSHSTINRRLSETPVSLTSAATQSTVNARLRSTPVPLATLATQTVDYLVLIGALANLAASSALVADVQKVAVFASPLASAFTQVTTPRRLRGSAVTLQGFYAQLSDGYNIHIDPYLTYLIAQETRLFVITTDVRDRIIPQETRLRQIPAETRIYAVDSDTRVNTIIGSAL